MDAMRQYDMEQRDLRLMASAVEMIQCWAILANVSHFNTKQGVVVRFIANERVPSLVFESGSVLSGSKGLDCAEEILRHIFGGANLKPFSRDEFVRASRMCLSASRTLELGKYVWPEEFVNNRPSPCPIIRMTKTEIAEAETVLRLIRGFARVGRLVTWVDEAILGDSGKEFVQKMKEEHGLGPFRVIEISEFRGVGPWVVWFKDKHGINTMIGPMWLMEGID